MRLNSIWIGIVWGGVTGFIIGIFISYNFVLPSHIFDITFAAMNISDFLRILGALVVIFFFAVIGSILGSTLRKLFN